MKVYGINLRSDIALPYELAKTDPAADSGAVDAGTLVVGLVTVVFVAAVAYAATFNGEQDVYYVRVFPDCNGNGLSDVDDTTGGGGSSDCNFNFIPDECEPFTGCGAAGAVPDGNEVAGEPLLLGKTA